MAFPNQFYGPFNDWHQKGSLRTLIQMVGLCSAFCWHPPTMAFFSRSILIQFESNCKSIILTALTWVRFFTTQGISFTRWHHPTFAPLHSCFVFFFFPFFFSAHFVATNKHKFPSNKIHICIGELKGTKIIQKWNTKKINIVKCNGRFPNALYLATGRLA